MHGTMPSGAQQLATLIIGIGLGLSVIACGADAAGSGSSDVSDGFSISLDISIDTAVSEVDTSTEPQVDAGPIDQVASIDRAIATINSHRDTLGFVPITIDPTLSLGCVAHIGYMRGEGKVVHEQSVDSVFYDPAGVDSGVNAVLAGGVLSMEQAMTLWLEELYQRISILDPGVSTVGAAFADGYACLDIFSGWVEQEDFAAYSYPVGGQPNVSPTYGNPGGLNPIPSDIPLPTGPVVSLTFPVGTEIDEDLKATIIDTTSGALVNSFIRLPGEESDPYATFHRNTVAITPLDPLPASTTFTVTVTGQVDGNFLQRTWSFATAP